jgi:hypothetical protein
MTNEIKIYDKKGVHKDTVQLHFNTQEGTLGRPFRLSGTRKNLQLPEKWVNGIVKWHWIYSFIYLDERGGFFEIEIDYNDKFVRLNKL